MDKKKVLIIKTGYSEILDKDENSRLVSLGDVFRTTPLLHLYKDYNVTWVTDSKAIPLLNGNPYITKLFLYDFTTALQLESEEFDIVINLEKVPGICALADKIRARRIRYGFTFNSQTGEAEAYEKSSDVLSVSSNLDIKKKNMKTAQELLFEMVGEKWQGEEYVLGYRPAIKEKYDICLNTLVGEKWPIKAWPSKNWDSLESILTKEGLKVTRQDKQSSELFKNIHRYIDWINSGDIFVSNDSLGLHLALALNKKVLGLFGPTPQQEVYFYNRGKAILPEPSPDCRPCFDSFCKLGKSCIENISLERVYDEIKEIRK